MRTCDLLDTLGILVKGLLEIVHTHIGPLVVVVDYEELLITKSEFYMLRLDVWLWDRGPDQLLSGHRVENTEPERGSRRQDILGVLSNIHRLDGLF